MSMLEDLDYVAIAEAVIFLLAAIFGGRKGLDIVRMWWRRGGVQDALEDLTETDSSPTQPVLTIRCSNCAHFDRDMFQREVLGKNPVFAEVARWKEPSAMGSRVEDGKTVDTAELPVREDTWDHFGVCVNVSSPNSKVAIHGSDHCLHFQPRSDVDGDVG